MRPDPLLTYFENTAIPPDLYSPLLRENSRMLYKYVPPSRIHACLPIVGDGTLRATQPTALNDPFECALSESFTRSDDLRHSAEFAQILTRINPTTPIDTDTVTEAKRKYGSLYFRQLLSLQLSKRLGIISFVLDPYHPLMWAHYADDSSGFAIGYDIADLIDINTRSNSLQPVRYNQDLIVLPGYLRFDDSDINALLALKSFHWKYEKEWRLIVELHNTIGTGGSDRFEQPINLLRIPNEAVRRVYYTERTPRRLVTSVRRRLQDPNNRYGTQELNMLTMSDTEYGYHDSGQKS